MPPPRAFDALLLLRLLLCLSACLPPQLFRKILDTRDHGEAVLREMVAEAKKGQAVAIDTGCAEDTSLVITPSNLQPGAQPVLQLSQEGQRLPPEHRPGRKGGRGPAQKKGKKQNKLMMTQEMAEALLAAYEAAPRQQQQQQGPDAATSSAAAAAAAAGVSGSSSAAEPALLPKEAFVLQLIRECCGVKAALKHEKVVVFSQVSTSGRLQGEPADWMADGFVHALPCYCLVSSCRMWQCCMAYSRHGQNLWASMHRCTCSCACLAPGHAKKTCHQTAHSQNQPFLS
jgi:hypothetical protein